MNRLARIANSAAPSTAVQFRKAAYGRDGVLSFLRDVLALANAAVDGQRYIVVGIELDPEGRRRIHAIDRDDFAGRPAYDALVADYIEPSIQLRYEPVTNDGQRIGIFEIGDCTDRPYMMRIDHCDKLRRGDAYVRVKDAPVKMGRRQLQALFEQKFRAAVPAASIEVGFPGEIMHKQLEVATQNLDHLPSTVASARLQELLAAKKRINVDVLRTTVRRLTHARLFGPDSPFEDRTEDEIRAELHQIRELYRDHDEQFLFEEHRTDIQVVIHNQNDERLQDASITFVMPDHPALFVAEQLPRLLKDDLFVDRPPAQQEGYPTVKRAENAIRVTADLAEIEPWTPAEAFGQPLRICCGNALKGRRVGIQYSLQARNLPAPVKGKLRLLF